MSDDFIDAEPLNEEGRCVNDSVVISPYTLLALTMLKNNLLEVSIDLNDIDKFVTGIPANRLPVVVVQDQGAVVTLKVMSVEDAFNYKKMVELNTSNLKAN